MVALCQCVSLYLRTGNINIYNKIVDSWLDTMLTKGLRATSICIFLPNECGHLGQSFNEHPDLLC